MITYLEGMLLPLALSSANCDSVKLFPGNAIQFGAESFGFAVQFDTMIGNSIPGRSFKLNVNPNIATLSRPAILTNANVATIDFVRVHLSRQMLRVTSRNAPVADPIAKIAST